jgi:type IVB pilus formation R64 PilN family outer membrane protein
MPMHRLIPRGSLLAMTLSLSACAPFAEYMGRVDGSARQRSDRMQAQQERFVKALSDPKAREAAQEVDQPWVAGVIQPLSREVTLPPALRAEVDTALMFEGGGVDLLQMAERIMLATGIPVRVRPDAMLPLSGFLPRLSGSDVSPSANLAAADAVSLPAGAHPLPRLLDLISNRLGVYWRHVDGSIEFYRTETRSFDVRALNLKSTASAALGRRSGGEQGAFESSGATRFDNQGQDALLAVRAKLDPLLTRAGNVVANADASNLITVTDTREALDRVAAFLDRENRALTRRVRLLFERVEVSVRDTAEQGVDWNVLAGRFALLAPGGTVGAAAASIGYRGENGSTVAVRALSELGTVVHHSAVPLQGLNRRPMTHAVRTTFSYVDQVQSTTVASASGTTTAPTVSQKEETVGSFLTIVPDAQDDGQILLSVSYDNTVAQPLKTLSFGSGNNEIKLQQKTVDGIGTVQQLQVRPGQPVIVSGFERDQSQYDRRTLDRNAPIALGGSGTTTRDRLFTLLILTAQPEEGL